jgi:hypothetical protein
MMDRETFQKKILSIKNETDFNLCAMELFRHQYRRNAVYRRYVDHIGIDPEGVHQYPEIPCLPISFFKTQRVSCLSTEDFEKGVDALVFRSSGTAQQERSSHYVYQASWYQEVAMRGFQRFFGSLEDYAIIAYLPSYYDNKQSSLLYMVEHFMRESKSDLSRYYDFTNEDMSAVFERCFSAGKKPWIIGVTYALLDWIEVNKTLTLDPAVILVETGGMKGRREEIVRLALHDRLKRALGLPKIYSEYGMCELLSQGYSFENEEFVSVPWLRFLLREMNDPFATINAGNGLIKIIDLANIDSCAFVETQDLGASGPLGGMKVLGRVDYSDLRGCNLMYEN